MPTQGTYTATNLPSDGQTIDASDVNTDLQGLIDEFNKNVGTSKIEDANVTAAKMATESWTSHTATLTGFSGTPTQANAYLDFGSFIILRFNINGTSNATGFTISLPVASKVVQTYTVATGNDNSAALTSPVRIDLAAGSTTATLYKDPSGAAWTNSGTKSATGVIIYEPNS